MSSSSTPREELRAAKDKFEKAKVTFAKAQEDWQRARRKFTDTIGGRPTQEQSND